MHAHQRTGLDRSGGDGNGKERKFLQKNKRGWDCEVVKLVKYLVYKKWRPSEGRVFVNEKLADSFIERVKCVGGAKLIKRKYEV